MSHKEQRTRAIALADNDIGQKRYVLYKNVITRINQACQDGYYLEAITLLESLITDRLESYLTFIKGENVGFENLGKLIDIFKSKALADKIDDELRNTVLQDVNEWRKKRNAVLHEMAKIDFGNQQTWEQKCQELDKIADDGLSIFRKIDKRLTALRRSKTADG